MNNTRRMIHLLVLTGSVVLIGVFAMYSGSTVRAQVACQPCADSCDPETGCGGSGTAGATDWCTLPQTGCADGFIANGTCCCQVSPVVVDLSGDGIKMTDASHGVVFAIGPTSRVYQVSWTRRDSDSAWLVLDRNNNGLIDDGKELFGNFTPQTKPAKGQIRNGFAALAEFDKRENGGNEDGKIDAQDNVFPLLRLWKDANHNGVSEPSELVKLESVGITGFDLKYTESKWTDEFGNRFRFRARVLTAKTSDVAKWAWDVFLLVGSDGPARSGSTVNH